MIKNPNTRSDHSQTNWTFTCRNNFTGSCCQFHNRTRVSPSLSQHAPLWKPVFKNWQLLYLELRGGNHTDWMKLEANCKSVSFPESMCSPWQCIERDEFWVDFFSFFFLTYLMIFSFLCLIEYTGVGVSKFWGPLLEVWRVGSGIAFWSMPVVWKECVAATLCAPGSVDTLLPLLPFLINFTSCPRGHTIGSFGKLSKVFSCRSEEIPCWIGNSGLVITSLCRIWLSCTLLFCFI